LRRIALIVNATVVLSLASCGVSLLGLRSALFMYAKSRAAARGELNEASVVELPEARLFFSIPNSLLGIFYYSAAIALASLAWSSRGLAALLLAITLCAFATSVFLAFRLVIRKRGCPHCWTSHAVNAALFFLALVQFTLKST
jgi:uncharacterized membrane protein